MLNKWAKYLHLRRSRELKVPAKFSTMKKISRVINLLPCLNLDDFPTHHRDEDAESLLANWTAAWHPQLIAASGSRPLWCSTDQTANPSPEHPDTHPHDDFPSAEVDPYFADLHSGDLSEDESQANVHNSPHAQTSYDGSPFSLSSPTTGNTAGTGPPPLWRDSVLLIPTIATSSLAEGFGATAAPFAAAMVAAQTDRTQIIAILSEKLKLRTDDLMEKWADEFYALGYAWLQVQLLTRKIRYSSNLDQIRFDNALIKAAQAVSAGEEDQANSQLTACYDTLMEEKNNYYPVKPDLIDLVLTTPKTLGKSFQAEVRQSHCGNYLMTGEVIHCLAEDDVATTGHLRQRLVSKTASLVGGNHFELPTPLLSRETTLRQIASGAAAAKEFLGTEPQVFLRRRAGLTNDLPLLLEQLNFRGAMHLSLDRGRVPHSSEGTLQWSGPGDSLIMAKSEAPLDASKAETFVDFSVKFGRQIDSAHSATMLLVHWPGKSHRALQDLIRVASRSPVLGTFQTLDDHFDQIYDPGYGDRFLPDEYRPGYLAEAARGNSPAPLSSVAQYWQRTFRLLSAGHLNTLIALIGKTRHAATLSMASACESFAKRIRQIQDDVDRDTHRWQAPSPVTDSAITALENDLLELLTQTCTNGASGAPHHRASGATNASGPSVAALVNPLGFRRRLSATVDSPPSNHSAVSFSHQPWQLGAATSKKNERRWLMDVDSHSLAHVEQHPEASISDARKEPDVLIGDKLQNEFFAATIDSKTGGLRSIQFHGKRGNRAGQRIVYHDALRPGVISQMICRNFTPNALSKTCGQITTSGVILIEGKEVADFRQVFRLSRGDRVLEVEIELSPKITLPTAETSWFASQLAWQDESCSISAACQMARYETVDPVIQSPTFVEISTSEYRLTLLAGGLPYHRRTARCRLDTLLLVAGEQNRRFRIGIGIDISHAVRTAIHFNSPVYRIENTFPAAGENPRGIDGKCQLHLDCKNIVSTYSEPVFSGERLTAVRLRLQETEGRSGRLHISTPHQIEKVVRQNLLGQDDTELTLDESAHRVGIDFCNHDFFQIQLTFATDS